MNERQGGEVHHNRLQSGVQLQLLSSFEGLLKWVRTTRQLQLRGARSSPPKDCSLRAVTRKVQRFRLQRLENSGSGSSVCRREGGVDRQSRRVSVGVGCPSLSPQVAPTPSPRPCNVSLSSARVSRSGLRAPPFRLRWHLPRHSVGELGGVVAKVTGILCPSQTLPLK